MNAAWSRSSEAASQLPGMLGIAAGHEGGRLLVPHLNETDFVLPFAKRLHDAVDAVTRQPEDHAHAPALYGVDQYVGCGSGHDEIPGGEAAGWEDVSVGLVETQGHHTPSLPGGTRVHILGI